MYQLFAGTGLSISNMSLRLFGTGLVQSELWDLQVVIYV